MENKDKIKKENVAVVRSKSLPISSKVSVEICNLIRGLPVEKAKNYMERVTKHKMAVPYKRYNKDTPHRPGKIAAGRYPEKAATTFLKLLNSLVANAEDKGLNSKGLVIVKAISNKGAQRYHTGRMRGIKMKATHIEIEAIEGVNKK